MSCGGRRLFPEELLLLLVLFVSVAFLLSDHFVYSSVRHRFRCLLISRDTGTSASFR